MLTEVGGGEAEFDLEGLGHRDAGLGSGDDGPDAVFPAELHEGVEVVDGGGVDGEVRHGGAVGQAAVEGAAVQAVGSALGPGIGSWMLLVLAAGAWAGFLGLTVAAAVLVLVAAALAATRRGDPRRAAARPTAAT
ncbi:hypothetical protein, partial [Corynebacterium bovis]